VYAQMEEGKTRLDSSDLHNGCRRAMQMG
jgi:hypothetical protein